MKTFLFSLLALTALSSVAMAGKESCVTTVFRSNYTSGIEGREVTRCFRDFQTGLPNSVAEATPVVTPPDDPPDDPPCDPKDPPGDEDPPGDPGTEQGV